MKRHQRDVRPRHGSAYLAALLALVLVSGAALATVLVARTEMLIGSNERALQGLFYAAESGISASIVRALGTDDRLPRTIELRPLDGAGITHEVASSGLATVLFTACDLCELHRSDYAGESFGRWAFVVTVRSYRRAGRNPLWQGAKTMTTIVEVQPWSSREAAVYVDPTDLAGIEL